MQSSLHGSTRTSIPSVCLTWCWHLQCGSETHTAAFSPIRAAAELPESTCCMMPAHMQALTELAAAGWPTVAAVSSREVMEGMACSTVIMARRPSQQHQRLSTLQHWHDDMVQALPAAASAAGRRAQQLVLGISAAAVVAKLRKVLPWFPKGP